DRLIDDVSRRPAARHVLAADARDPHGDGDVGDPPVLAADPTLDDAARRLDGEAVAGHAAALDQPAREDAQPVAALLRLAAVGVEDAQPGVGGPGRHQRQHAVASHAAMAVAQAAHGVRRECKRQRVPLDDEVVVAERVSLDERVGHCATTCRSDASFSRWGDLVLRHDSMSTADDLRDVRPGRQRVSMLLAVLVTLPALALRAGEFGLSHPVEALLYGLAIVGAAFMLSWAAEVAQLDVSAGLAIAVLAFVAVLPEYAVDLVFAFKAGSAVAAYGPACRPPGGPGETPCSLALANMTGANRLLIGIGWSMVVFVAWYRSGRTGVRLTEVVLERSHAVELAFLAMATLYSLTLPLKETVTLLDAAILGAIFVAYTVRIASAPAEEPHLVGPARYLGTLGVGTRRAAVVGLFIYSAIVILLVAERFAEALVGTGREFQISE